jgi:hypothetical protein
MPFAIPSFAEILLSNTLDNTQLVAYYYATSCVFDFSHDNEEFNGPYRRRTNRFRLPFPGGEQNPNRRRSSTSRSHLKTMVSATYDQQDGQTVPFYHGNCRIFREYPAKRQEDG